MQLAFLTDPLASLQPKKDSTFVMLEEAQRRGHQLFVAEPGALFALGGRICARLAPLRMTGRLPDWYALGEAETRSLISFDAVLMRKDPPFDLQFLYATHLLSRAEAQGARVFNSGQALRDHNEKLALLEFPEWTPPTLVSQDQEQLRAFVAAHEDAILKPLDSMGGTEIFRVSPHDVNLSVVLETITHRGSRTVMAQRYVPEIVHGDKRVLLIDGRPVDYCLARIPKEGELRGNLAAGAHGESRPLTRRDRQIAEALGPILRARGLLLVGLDVIGDYLTEINVTSPTCFREITVQTGLNVAGLMLDAVEKACR